MNSDNQPEEDRLEPKEDGGLVSGTGVRGSGETIFRFLFCYRAIVSENLRAELIDGRDGLFEPPPASGVKDQLFKQIVLQQIQLGPG